jgi:tRNA(Arg) A34 adenosine deaminase TadA
MAAAAPAVSPVAAFNAVRMHHAIQ